jgi:hypothetical protein
LTPAGGELTPVQGLTIACGGVKIIACRGTTKERKQYTKALYKNKQKSFGYCIFKSLVLRYSQKRKTGGFLSMKNDYVGIICPACGNQPVIHTLNKADYFICCDCHTKLVVNKK